MQLWRRVSIYALAGLCSVALVACSGSDGSGDEDDSKGGFSKEKSAKLDAPDEVNFKSLDIGESQEQTIELANNGESTLKLKSIKLVEGNEDDKKEFRAGKDWVNKANLAPDEEMPLSVVYRPLNETEDKGHIVLETNDVRKKFQTFRIELKPSDLAPNIDVQSAVNFSSVPPGTQVGKRVPVKNLGQAPLEINKVKLTGSELFKVTLAKDQTSGDKGSKGKNNKMMGNGGGGLKPEKDDPISNIEGTSLEPDESVDLRVWFAPEDNSPEKADLTIFSNDPNDGQKTIKVLGNSGTPCLGLSHEEEINFGASSTGQVATKTVTIENCRARATELEIHDIKVTNDGGGVFGVKKASLPGDLDKGKKFTIKGDNRANFVVTFTPPKKQSYQGELLIKSNDPSRTNHKIKLVGKGTDNECPEAIAEASVKGNNRKKTTLNTLPLETIKFDGTSSNDPDGSIKRYEWSIIKRPEDSTARLTPNSSVEKPEMFLDLAGEYKVELVVYDNDQAASCGKQAIVTIKAIPQEDIHVQLVWDTPADSDQTDTTGADLDLHYLSPKATSWNEAPYDIFWHNKEGDWGQQNVKSDDPSLDIDDTDGAGPENVNHNNPVSGNNYTVGIYYYDDHGFGPSYATVRIYIDGTLKKEFKNKFMSGTFDFWKVGLIEWPSKNIYKRDEKFTGFPNSN